MANKGGRRKGVTFEIKNVNWKPEELHRLVEEVTGRRQGTNDTSK
jgi:hypothetical protein